MVDSPRAVPKQFLRYLILVNVVPVGAAAVLAWAVVGVAYLRQRFGVEVPTHIYLAIAIVVTLGGALHAFLRLRRALRLAQVGIEVDAVISNVGTVTGWAMVRIDCRYTWRSKTYFSAWSGAVGEFSPGDHVALFIDPRNPRRCLRKDLVFCKGPADAATAQPGQPARSGQDSSGWKWWYFVLAGIGIGVFSVYLFFDLAAFERAGGARTLDRFTAIAYELGGKWGVLATGGVLALFTVAIGIWDFIAPSSPKTPPHASEKEEPPSHSGRASPDR